MCYVSALSETTVTVQTFSNHPKVTGTSNGYRKERPLLPAKSENNGGRYFRNSTVCMLGWNVARALQVLSRAVHVSTTNLTNRVYDRSLLRL